MLRYAFIAGGVAIALLAIFHPAPRAPQSLDGGAATPERDPASRRVADPAISTIVVYVAGAVRRPGIYRLRADARADDAVRRAGGLADSADAAGINLAERLEDGEEVDVPVRGASPRKRRSTHSRRRSHRGASGAGIVDVNHADAQALGSVPGIGAAIAERIVEVREREGAFDSFDELLDVAGMNESRLERARPHLEL